jgi:hypothetical protein
MSPAPQARAIVCARPRTKAGSRQITPRRFLGLALLSFEPLSTLVVLADGYQQFGADAWVLYGPQPSRAARAPWHGILWSPRRVFLSPVGKNENKGEKRRQVAKMGLGAACSIKDGGTDEERMVLSSVPPHVNCPQRLRPCGTSGGRWPAESARSSKSESPVSIGRFPWRWLRGSRGEAIEWDRFRPGEAVALPAPG